MSKQKNDSEFTTLYVKKDVSERVETLKGLVEIDKGLTNVSKYDAVATAIDMAIRSLSKKHRIAA